MARQKAVVVSAATTNATSKTAATTMLQTLELTNTTATPAFFKIYDKASAPTVGTDVPVVTIPVPANSNVGKGWPNGLELDNGYAYAITGAITDADVTATVVGIKVYSEWL